MRRRRPVTVGMDMRMLRPRVAPVVRRSSGIHEKVLYYNITHVHRASRTPSGSADGHGHGGGQKREWERDGGPKPHESGWHEGDFPEQQPLEGKQGPGDDVGQHLRWAAAGLQGNGGD